MPGPGGTVMTKVGGGLALVTIRASTSLTHSARRGSKGPSHVNSFSPPSNPMGLALLSFPLYRCVN